MKVWTKLEIKQMLAVSNNALIRSLLAIYNKQTDSEKNAGQTQEDNGIGFNGIDSDILSQYAEFYKLRGFLSPKQLVIVRKKMPKYAGQLVRIANGELQ